MDLHTNKEFDVGGNWYKPLEKLEELPGVVIARHLETTSSAGDWGGYFVQKIKDRFYFIPFSQENKRPNSESELEEAIEFRVKTGDLFSKWNDGNSEYFEENLEISINNFLELNC